MTTSSTFSSSLSLSSVSLGATGTATINLPSFLMKAVDVRHLKGLKGVFRVNETELHHNIILDEQSQIAIMISSNISETIHP